MYLFQTDFISLLPAALLQFMSTASESKNCDQHSVGDLSAARLYMLSLTCYHLLNKTASAEQEFWLICLLGVPQLFCFNRLHEMRSDDELVLFKTRIGLILRGKYAVMDGKKKRNAQDFVEGN